MTDIPRRHFVLSGFRESPRHQTRLYDRTFHAGHGEGTEKRVEEIDANADIYRRCPKDGSSQYFKGQLLGADRTPEHKEKK